MYFNYKKILSISNFSIILLVIFILLGTNQAFALSFSSEEDGSWNDGATWGLTSPGVDGIDYPGAMDDAIILTEVTLNQDQSIHNITITTNGVLDLGANTFSVSGDFANHGVLNAGASTVVLTGGNQTILGANTFNNLTKTTNVADTLSFDPENVTRVTGNLTLTGTSTGLLTAKSADVPVFVSKFGRSVTSVEGNFLQPRGIATDSLGNIYVVELANQRVQKFDSSGNFLLMFGWGVQDGTNQFQICASGCQPGVQGANGGQFDRPLAVAVDSTNNIYFVDSGNNRVQKFDSSGNFISTFGWGVEDGANEFQVCTENCQQGSEGDGDGQFLSSYAITIDSLDNIYIADSGNNRIQKFSPSFTFISKWGSLGSSEGQFESLQGITTDTLNNVYAVDSNNHRVQKFNSSGTFLLLFGWDVQDFSDAFQICTSQCQAGARGSLGDGQFNFPTDITTDSLNNIYVADTNSNRIQKFDSSGNFISKWGTLGSGNGQFNAPEGITSDASNNIYVTEGNRVQKFDSSGTFISKFGNNIDGGLFTGPRGIAFNSEGDIYVSDTANSRIQKFDSSGNFLLTFGWGVQDGSDQLQICALNCQSGILGSGDGQFDSPTSLAFDSLGNLFVVDSYNNRVQTFDSDDNYVSQFGSVGAGDGEFDVPQGIAIDSSDKIYITDIENFRVQKFTVDGEFETAWGTQGEAEGEFSTPYDIDIDSFGDIYVSDTSNHRIQKFSSIGTFIETFGWGVQDGTNEFQTCMTGCIAGNSGGGRGQFSQPRGIFIDSNNNLYVFNNNTSTVQKLDFSHNFLTVWGALGNGNGEFGTEADIALDAIGDIYVLDGDNGRVQKFTTTGNSWQLDSQGTSSLSFLSVSLSNSTSAVSCTDCTDGGNNTNWDFGNPATPPSSGGERSRVVGSSRRITAEAPAPSSVPIPLPIANTITPPMIINNPQLMVNRPNCLINITLRFGSRGEQVKCLQTTLGGLVIDGIYGVKTKAAVVFFQLNKSNQTLVPDGIFGPLTRAVWERGWSN